MYEAISKCYSIKYKTSIKNPVHLICYYALEISSVRTTANWKHTKMATLKVKEKYLHFVIIIIKM